MIVVEPNRQVSQIISRNLSGRFLTLNQNRKKWISIFLLAGMVLSSLTAVTSGFASGLLEPIINTIVPNNSQRIEVKPLESSKEMVLQTKQGSTMIALTEGSGNFKVSETDSMTPSDKHNITREQVDKLFNEGFSLQDLLKADELANIWDVDPLQLLEEKKQSEWTSIENRLQLAKYGPLVDELKRKHPDAGKLLDKEILTLGEQFSLLALVDQSLVPDMKDALDRYLAKGREGIAEIHRENRFYGKVSKTNMEKYGLTEKEAIGLRLTDEKLSRMEQVSGSAMADLLEKKKNSLSHQIQEQIDVAGGSDKP